MLTFISTHLCSLSYHQWKRDNIPNNTLRVIIFWRRWGRWRKVQPKAAIWYITRIKYQFGLGCNRSYSLLLFRKVRGERASTHCLMRWGYHITQHTLTIFCSIQTYILFALLNSLRYRASCGFLKCLSDSWLWILFFFSDIFQFYPPPPSCRHERISPRTDWQYVRTKLLPHVSRFVVVNYSMVRPEHSFFFGEWRGGGQGAWTRRITVTDPCFSQAWRANVNYWKTSGTVERRFVIIVETVRVCVARAICRVHTTVMLEYWWASQCLINTIILSVTALNQSRLFFCFLFSIVTWIDDPLAWLLPPRNKRRRRLTLNRHITTNWVSYFKRQWFFWLAYVHKKNKILILIEVLLENSEVTLVFLLLVITSKQTCWQFSDTDHSSCSN